MVSATLGFFFQIQLAQRVDHADHLGGERGVGVGDAGAQDLDLALGAGEVEPQVQAAAAQGVRELAGVVRGEDHQRARRRAQRAELGDGDLELGQHLEEEGLELGLGAVDLVDEQDARAAAR
jgi:hypothetical protein